MQSIQVNELTVQEKNVLLHIARTSISAAVTQAPLPDLDIDNRTPALQADGASFVTLTKNGRLRGCIGTMQPYQPLIADVQEHAVAAAMSDFRFPHVKENELQQIKIEISRLTPLEKLAYESADGLLTSLRIGIDGVLVRSGSRQATFLPQVWEQLPKPEKFLSQLCLKMGVSSDFWKEHPMEVFIYQVEKFREE